MRTGVGVEGGGRVLREVCKVEVILNTVNTVTSTEVSTVNGVVD